MESQSVNTEPENNAAESPQWKPLTSRQRRVAGVLVEKSKTTPDVYPMTINAIKTGCNQKSNRSPKMELDAEDVSETLDELRLLGAVIEVMGDGRTTKFKHRLYDWLSVDRAELAVMTELLLRGEQSLGDLRARAARMEKIAGLNELKPIIQQLLDKKLMVALTPAGRGQIVTHNLYDADELERIKARYEGGVEVADVPSARASGRDSDSAQSEIVELRERIEAIERQLLELQEKLA